MTRLQWCLDLTASRADVTTRISHAFPIRADGELSRRTLCGLECDLRQDVAHTKYQYTECAVCRAKEQG